MKEFHVFTHIEKTHEQAFIFEVERDIEKNLLRIRELWMVTVQNSGEVKARIKFEDMMMSISDNVGGNIRDCDVPTIVNVFNELIPKEHQQEIIDELVEKEQQLEELRVRETDSNQLISASEFVNNFDLNGNIDQIVQNIINSKKQ